MRLLYSRSSRFSCGIVCIDLIRLTTCTSLLDCPPFLRPKKDSLQKKFSSKNVEGVHEAGRKTRARKGGSVRKCVSGRICTPPLEGLRSGDAHTNKNAQHTHSLLQVQNRIPQALSPPATEKHRFPSPSPPATTDGSTRGPQTAAPPPRRRAAGRTETAHTRRRAPRSHTHQTDRGKEAVVTTMATAGQRIDCIAGENAA